MGPPTCLNRQPRRLSSTRPLPVQGETGTKLGCQTTKIRFPDRFFLPRVQLCDEIRWERDKVPHNN